MKVLVACEFSGVVRDAFIERGHDAVSCDLIQSERHGPHIVGDVSNHLGDGWDLLIAHPPCTYLANSGVSWLVRGGVVNRTRWELMVSAARFFQKLWLCDIERVCIENPVMHKHAKHAAGIAYCYDTSEYKQIIHPWMFGHPESKATCLWLRNLPKLKETNNVY